jgi:transposase-like protein
MEEDTSFMQSADEDNSDGISSYSKKIAKRRCAYQKIDDDVRLQLLEAVQKKKETLKSASKRLGINYSSAKSILHTYRKEGRILKKSLLERVIPTSSQAKNSKMDVSPMAAQPQSQTSHSPSFRKLNFAQKSHMTTKEFSPLNGLTKNFGHLFLNAKHLKEDASVQKSQVSGFTLIPSIKLPVQMSEPSPSNAQIHLQHMMKPVVNQSPNNPLGVLKRLDNFYLNYSNSPLSGGAAHIFSDSSSHKQFPTEFDSFSEMVSALQNQPCSINQSTGDLYIQNPLAFNSPRFAFNRIDSCISNEDNAVTMIRGLIETQQLLADTLQTASYINNLIQIQRTSPGVSPCSIWTKH